MVLKKIELYQDLVRQLGVDSQIPIFYKTSVTVFKRLDFKDAKLQWLGTEQIPAYARF
ncbi:hypothetical protein HK413_04650 [Mucilaginibacter sp. S1162]|uniref:Uncharacterized protein n=1 Tax=Mucilaginibacter humi TaxID=2732510 RepID=A0ABX1W075_9SPHI|nr:hypothetical protein [Mucilaginibacter humi]NNU33617.1 hypothetical protein [Mucilaginibacter humi]